MSNLILGAYWNDKYQRYNYPRLAEADRATHLYVIGASGQGKSRFLEFLIAQDLGRHGFGVIDPHGDLTDSIKGHLLGRPDLHERVIVIDPEDPGETVTFNPLEQLPGISPAEQALELVAVFKKLWQDSWGARMEDLLKNSLVCLIENNLTLLELPLFLTNDQFREQILKRVRHPIAQQYFKEHFSKLSEKTRHEWIESTLNKVDTFLFDDRIRDMLSCPTSSFNIREIMDREMIWLVKLSKNRLKDNADLLGALLIAKLQMAALSRAELPEAERIPFYLYVDEFQHFATDTFVEILSEARKYGLRLILAHQTLSQLHETSGLEAAILGNTGIQVYFRVSRSDAEILAKEAFATSGLEPKHYRKASETFEPEFYTYSEEWEEQIGKLTTLKRRTCYAKHKGEGGVILLEVPDVESKAGGGKRRGQNLGARYRRSREELQRAYAERRKQLNLDEADDEPKSFKRPRKRRI
jgi:type IV secretory pathway VirB4 component